MSRTALQQLEKLDAAIRRTAGEIAEAERGHEAARRDLAAAEAALRDYNAANVEADTAELDRLIAVVNRVRSRLMPDPRNGRTQLDIAVHARVGQLRKAEGLQRQRRADWVQENARAVEAELIAEAKARRDELHDAIRALNSSASAWAGTAQQFSAVAELLGYDRREIPSMPIENALRILQMNLSQYHDVPAPVRAVGMDNDFTFDARTPVGAAQ